MNILVCVKQVINLESDIRIDSNGTWIQMGPATDFAFNRFDEFAVEEAIEIKEAFPGTTIDILSVGPERAATVIKRLQGMGADHGIHILTGQEGYISPFVIAGWIAQVCRKKEYDLILAGVMSEDEMQGQVGPTIAAILDRPCATSVVHQSISSDVACVAVEREIENGLKDTLELTLPAVLTIQSGINEPRYPTLTHMLRAKKEKIEVIDAESLESVETRQRVKELAYPKKLRSGTVLKGDPKEKAVKLVSILHQRSII
ncbi:MAG: electron transfer flavoprotein subunit beta/FixA family protein [Desulfobacterales bacterium]